jgi:hypothetical protein
VGLQFLVGNGGARARVVWPEERWKVVVVAVVD